MPDEPIVYSAQEAVFIEQNPEIVEEMKRLGVLLKMFDVPADILFWPDNISKATGFVRGNLVILKMTRDQTLTYRFRTIAEVETKVHELIQEVQNANA